MLDFQNIMLFNVYVWKHFFCGDCNFVKIDRSFRDEYYL